MESFSATLNFSDDRSPLSPSTASAAWNFPLAVRYIHAPLHSAPGANGCNIGRAKRASNYESAERLSFPPPSPSSHCLYIYTYTPQSGRNCPSTRRIFGLRIRTFHSEALFKVPRSLLPCLPPISALLFFVPLYIGAGSPLSLLFRPVLQLPDRRKIPCTARPREVFVRLNKLNASSQRSTVHS